MENNKPDNQNNIIPSPLCNRVLLLILDGAGVGALPDAANYGDEGAATLPNLSRVARGINLPVLQALGLGNIAHIKGVPPAESPLASYGKMGMLSRGKDTTTGHWEIAGLILPHPLPLYPEGFPEGIINKFENAVGRKILGNKSASGTEIIAELGEEHLKTGSPIVYTSADSVFQIAAHEKAVSPEVLYGWCLKAREILTGRHSVGRVIARPFEGPPGGFKRTSGRRDYSLPPLKPTMLDLLSADGVAVALVGKIKDIFAGRGLTTYIPVKGDNDSVREGVAEALKKVEKGLIWANFNDFDTLYGHRNDVKGYVRALEVFDKYLGSLINNLSGGNDYLIITADHGCDPTHPGTDHTREYVPLLIFSLKDIEGRKKDKIPGYNLGTRESMSDLGSTILDLLGVENRGDISGKTFVDHI